MDSNEAISLPSAGIHSAGQWEGQVPEVVLGGVKVHLSPADAALIRGAESGSYEPYALYLINRQAQEIALRPSFDTLVSPKLARNIVPYEHQIQTVRRTLSRMRGRALLCDEVGLGKTIEAGLILLELIVRGLARTVLILTPPGLTGQWREEMASKFNQDFINADDERFRLGGLESWKQHPRIIGSLSLAKRPLNASAILSREFDLLILDEAHHVRNRDTVAWKFIRQIRKRYALFLTATPVHNHLEELYNLVTLLAPGQMGTLREFRRQHLDRGEPLKPRDPERLRALLSDVMVRNRRSTSGIPFTRRYASTLRVEPSAEERALYQKVSHLVRIHYRAAPSAERLVWMTLQMEMGSTPQAASSTLRKLAASRNLPEASSVYRSLAEQTERLVRPAKLERLITLVQEIRDKTVIFSRYRASLESIVAALREAGIQPAIYHGGLTRKERDAAIERFRGEVPVLVSSEAGGEGRNLQFCSNLINFDLPWNPMQIEQRIGRISRIGQERDVYVWNLCSAGTLEDHLLHLLEAKIHLFELVIGEIDMILGRWEEDREFEEILFDLWTQAEDEKQFTSSLAQLGERLVAAKQEYVRAREVDDRLFGDDLKA